MNITMILFGFFPSDVRVRKEALSLMRVGHKLTVVCCNEKDNPKEYELISIPRVGKISDWQGKMTTLQLLKFSILTFQYLISTRNFDVLHCHDLTGLPPAVWYKIIFPRTKIIYDSHEIFPEGVREKQGNTAALFFILLDKFCIKFVNRIIGVSLPQKELMEERYNISNFVFLPNFPSKAEIYPGKKVESNKIKILYSGRIHKNRGYEELLEATNILSQKRNDFIVQLVGDGPFRAGIEEMITKKKLEVFFEITGHVHFTEVTKYYNNADMGIALYQPTPNNYFGLSNKIFEYIICELPIIYPYYKGCIEYLKKVGGVHVDPTSPTDIALKIEYLMNNPKVGEEMRKAERLLAPDIVWESIEHRIIDLYESL